MVQKDQPSPGEGVVAKIKRAFRWLGRTTQSRIRGFPIVGPLANCTLKHHKATIPEFVITILFGTVTFWVTALFLMAFTANSGASYLQLLHKTISTGQLFIFAVGMLGPILIASAEDPANSRQFPGRTNHLAMIVLLGALASGFYGFVLASREPQAQGLLDTQFLFHSSVVLAVIVVIMRYLTTVYRKSTASFDAEENLKAPVERFADEFQDRHPAIDESSPRGSNAAAQEMINRFNGKGGERA